MKRSFAHKNPFLLDITVAIVLAAIWGTLVKLRDSLMTLFCAEAQNSSTGPSGCSPLQVNPIDRWVIGMKYDSTIDGLSFFTQYFAGFAVFVFIIYIAFFSKNKSPKHLYRFFFSFLHITLMNGVLMESVRLFIQRPRPWLYDDIIGFGSQTANYTSFYSGHTSFAALSAAVTYLMIRSVKQNRLVGREWAFPAIMFINAILTGIFRVFANRHFPTDVIGGLIAGSGVAWTYWMVRFKTPPVM